MNDNRTGGFSTFRIFSLLCAFLYAVRVIWQIPGAFSNLGGMLGRHKVMSFLWLDCSLLSILSCALLAYLLFLLGMQKDEAKWDPLYLLVLVGAAIRVAVVTLCTVIRLFYMLVSHWHISGLALSWAKPVLCAVATVGGLFLFFTVSGVRPFDGKTKEDFAAMAEWAKTLVPQETRAIFANLQNGTRTSQRSGTNGAAADRYAGANGYARTNGYAGADNYGGMNDHAGTGTNAGTGAYGSAAGYAQNATYGNTPSYSGYPRTHVKDDRSLLLYIIFGILTCSIYCFYFMYSMSKDINTICEGDGLHTGGLGAMIGYYIITCGWYGVYWGTSTADRLKANGVKYGVNVEESGLTYLLWCVPGIFLCLIGPYVAMHILIKNTNRLAKAYNEKYHV
ncbi:MAG: DUF4234 domain-containing protein [Clostridiales bacterium]|nr:DUF4234 domain-containing protein [Clostridiales bacterium]